MVRWYVNGTDLADFGIQRGSVYRSPLTVRGKRLTIPGQHGNAPLGKAPEFEAPPATFQFLIRGTKVDERAFALQALLALPRLLLAREDLGLTVTADAELASFTPGKYLPGNHAYFDASLTLPAVFFRGPLTDSPVVPVSPPQTTTFPTLNGSTAPVTDPVFRFAGPVTAVQLTDPATLTGLTWAGSGVTSGQYLYLDAGNLRAWRTSSATQWVPGGTDVTSGLDYPPAGLLQMWPDAGGEVRVRVEGSGFGTTTSLMVRAAPSYL